ncbi:MAG: hypothetical protein ACP5MC_02025 [Candidatus Micrarchaeia archaeon]
MTDFEEAKKLAASIRQEQSAPKSFLVDPSQIKPAIEVNTLTYSDLLRQLGFIKPERIQVQRPQQEAQLRPVQQPKAQPQAQPQVQAQPPLAARKPMVEEEKPKPAAAAKPVKPQRHIFEKELKEATEKLEKISKVSSEIEGEIAKQQEKKQVKGLILPTLSINDQLSDLEKISEGLSEHVFNAEQLKIIKLEANGLARLIAEGKEASAPEDLAEMRNNLLKQVIDAANAYVV